MYSVWQELLVIAVLILANGFFAGAELAIISARKSRIAQLIAEGDRDARIVDSLQRDPHRFLATVQVGVTLVGSMAAAVGGATAVEFLKPILQSAPFAIVRNAAAPLALTLVVLTIAFFSLIFGELVPKALALRYADRMALKVARTISLLSRVGVVAVWILTFCSKGILALLGVRGEGTQPFVTREEISHIMAEGQKSGVFSEEEHEYIRNIFDFTHTSVREVMVPRTRMVALDLDLPRDEMVREILENQYSRYPVYRDSIENMEGFIHGKDFLGRAMKDSDFDLSSIVRSPFYVPEAKKVNELLKEMQRKRVHMALVVDEYGGISGLVTTEDLLEELVGEIEDEHDIGEPRRVQRLPDGSFMVDALISVSDLEDLLAITLEDGDTYDTLAGFILAKLGRFPERGERLEQDRYAFICEDVKATAIVRVRILPLAPVTTQH
jgi:putative hemolysin